MDPPYTFLKKNPKLEEDMSTIDKPYSPEQLKENLEVYEESKVSVEDYLNAWGVHIALLDMLINKDPRPCYPISLRFCEDQDQTLEVEMAYTDVEGEEVVTLTYTLGEAKKLFCKPEEKT